MSTPKTKRGYRPLTSGETIQAGDLTWFASRWQTVESFRDTIGRAIEGYSYRCCRPIVQPAAKPLRKTTVKKGGRP